jgi:hypothetical protein
MVERAPISEQELHELREVFSRAYDALAVQLARSLNDPDRATRLARAMAAVGNGFRQTCADDPAPGAILSAIDGPDYSRLEPKAARHIEAARAICTRH